MFTISTDGAGHIVYAFAPSYGTLRIIVTILLALLLCLALALIELCQLAATAFVWLMAAPLPVVVRLILIVATILALVIVPAAIRAHAQKEAML